MLESAVSKQIIIYKLMVTRVLSLNTKTEIVAY